MLQTGDTLFNALKENFAARMLARETKKAKKVPGRFAPMKTGVQKFGNILSGCIMPVIGVIIAWGIATAFFIPTGWTPVKALDTWIVGPVINYLIPALIGFMGGYNVYKIRGGMMGAFITMTVIGGVKAYEAGLIYSNMEIYLNGKSLSASGLGPQFLCAMLVGPLSAFILKKTENMWASKIPVGFEMLVNNFYFGFLGIVLGAVGFYDMVFVSIGFNYIFGVIINWLTGWNGLPLTSLFVEPAKPLFLNNAINHGVFTPLGQTQVAGGANKSILFLIESNPGPGMGMLLGILLFDKNKVNKGQAGGASIIHFFGGIHEVYFPFIIARPWLLLSTMAGGVFGVSMFQAFGVGARTPVSPGSVISQYTFVNSSGLDYAGLSIGIFGAIAAALLVTFILFKTVYRKQAGAKSMNEAIAIMNARKGTASKYVQAIGETFEWAKVNFVAFVCDAGMGSSALGANIVRKELKQAGLTNIEVKNFAITNTPEEAQVIVVQKELANRVRALNHKGYIYEIDQFLDKKGYEELLSKLKDHGNSAKSPPSVQQTSEPQSSKAQNDEAKAKIPRYFVRETESYTRETIMKRITELLMRHEVSNDSKKLQSTLEERASSASIYMGSGLILPHPTEQGRSLIQKEMILIQWFEKAFEYEGNKVNFAITLALKGNSHMDELANIAETFGSSTEIDGAVAAMNEAQIRKLLNA